MIDKINTERHEHIITIEDPIEYLHPHKNCVVNQREVGADTETLQEGAQVHPAPGPGRRAGRRDARPRDDRGGADHRRDRPPRASRTLHTNSRVQTINRIIDVFPPHQQSQIRAQLSFVLEGVISQTLLPRADGHGPRARARGDGPERRHPEPDPRGQDPPDLLADADRPGEVRHADDEPVAWRACYSQRLITPEEAIGAQLRPGRAAAR